MTTASRKVLTPVSGLLEMNTVQQKSSLGRICWKSVGMHFESNLKGIIIKNSLKSSL